MIEATLKTELENLAPTNNEAAAISTLTDTYGIYASDATAASPILPTGVELGKTAMAGALVGMSAPGAGIAKIPAAIIAFWGAVAGGLASSFAGAIAITPPEMFVSKVDWSSDSRELVFAVEEGHEADLWIYQLEGGALKRLTDLPTFGSDPDWHP